jgi:hypothetical protein
MPRQPAARTQQRDHLVIEQAAWLVALGIDHRPGRARGLADAGVRRRSTGLMNLMEK